MFMLTVTASVAAHRDRRRPITACEPQFKRDTRYETCLAERCSLAGFATSCGWCECRTCSACNAHSMAVRQQRVNHSVESLRQLNGRRRRSASRAALTRHARVVAKVDREGVRQRERAGAWRQRRQQDEFLSPLQQQLQEQQRLEEQARAPSVDGSDRRWPPEQIASFIAAHPQRAYFSRLFRDGGFRAGIEVGVLEGRLSEHFLSDVDSTPTPTPRTPWTWLMVEPFPIGPLVSRLPAAAPCSPAPCAPSELRRGLEWAARGIGRHATARLIRASSLAVSSGAASAHRKRSSAASLAGVHK